MVLHNNMYYGWGGVLFRWPRVELWYVQNMVCPRKNFFSNFHIFSCRIWWRKRNFSILKKIGHTISMRHGMSMLDIPYIIWNMVCPSNWTYHILYMDIPYFSWTYHILYTDIPYFICISLYFSWTGNSWTSKMLALFSLEIIICGLLCPFR